jgi:hypothetical protein
MPGQHCSISIFTARLIDVIRTGYVEENVDQLFERAGNNVHTINVRMLWDDVILTRDHRVVQHVLATGFPDFDKGSELKLQYARRPSVLNGNITLIHCTLKALWHVWQRDI